MVPMPSLASAVKDVGWNLLDARITFPSLTWAVSYAICGRLARCYVKGSVNKMPLHSYAGPILHQLGAHPTLLVLLCRQLYLSGTGSGSKGWWGGSWDTVGSPYASHVQYSSIGLMLEGFLHFVDVWNSSKLDFFGFAVHHVVTMMGCSMWLLAPSGANIGTVVALNAEISSSFYCLFKVRPSPRSAALYALTQPVSLGIGIWGTLLFSRRDENAQWAFLCQVLCVLLVGVRLAAYIMEVPVMKEQLFAVRQHAE